jgi:SAM-dependent methyltransferase
VEQEYILTIRKIEEENIEGEFIQSKSSNIPFETQFDIVHCFSVLYHILDDNEWEKTLEEIERNTKPGGLILLRINWTEQVDNDAEHVKRRPKSDYKKFFESKELDIIEKHDIKDEPLTKKFPSLPNFFNRVFGKLGLFKINETEKIIVLRK